MPLDICSIAWEKVFGSIKDVVVAGAAVFTSWIAWRGITKWQAEQRGKADFEAARTVARALYEVRDALSFARQAMLLSSEYPQEFNGLEKSNATERAMAYAHVFGNRLKPVNAAGIELQTARHEAEALWGKEARRLVDEVLECIRDLRVGMQAYVSNEQHGGQDFKEDTFGDAMRARVFDVTMKYPDLLLNPFSKKISERIDAVDQMLQQHLRNGKSPSRK